MKDIDNDSQSAISGLESNDASNTDNPSSSNEYSSSVGGTETRTLRKLRTVAMFLLFLAIPLAVAVCFFIQKSEKDEFDFQYKEFAQKVLQNAGVIMQNTFGAFDNLAATVVASVRFANQTWPLVRVDDFAFRTAKTLSLSRAKRLAMILVVTDDTYDAWNDWTTANDRIWIDRSLEIMKTDPNYYGPIIEEYETINAIYTSRGVEPKEEG